jgi:hypothetical protein
MLPCTIIFIIVAAVNEKLTMGAGHWSPVSVLYIGTTKQNNPNSHFIVELRAFGSFSGIWTKNEKVFFSKGLPGSSFSAGRQAGRCVN